ncbi:MAG: PqqD family protein [Methylococcales bacterium]
MRLEFYHPNIVYESFPDEAVVANLDNGLYYSINPVGAQIWELMVLGLSENDIIDYMTGAYSHAAKDYVATSIGNFLRQLQQEQIIRVTANRATPLSHAVFRITNVPFEPPCLEKYTDMQDLLLLDPIHDVDERGWPHQKAN